MGTSRYEVSPKCEKTVLGNGVRVLTERLEHVDSVSLGVWVAGGSREEPVGQEGITHFIEHMMFKGTERRAAEEIAAAVDDLGGNVNGYTERESLCLLARTVGEQTGQGLELLFDLLLHSVCGKAEVEREKEVVAQEIRHVEDTPEDWVHDLLVQEVWQGHPLGRPPLGDLRTIGQLDAATVREYWERICVGGRLLVAAAGKVDHQEIVRLVEQQAGYLPKGQEPPPARPPEFRPGRKLVSRPTGQVHLCLATPSCERKDERRHAFSVLDAILGGGASSRLFQEIRERRGLVYHIGSYLQAYDGAGLLTVDAGTAPQNLDLVVKLIGQEVDRLRKEGPTPEEVERAKTQLKVGLALATESTGFRMHHLATSEMVWGRVWSFAELVERVEAVTAEEVHVLAKSVFTDEGSALVAIGPFSEVRRG